MLSILRVTSPPGLYYTPGPKHLSCHCTQQKKKKLKKSSHMKIPKSINTNASIRLACKKVFQQQSIIMNKSLVMFGEAYYIISHKIIRHLLWKKLYLSQIHSNTVMVARSAKSEVCAWQISITANTHTQYWIWDSLMPSIGDLILMQCKHMKGSWKGLMQ